MVPASEDEEEKDGEEEEEEEGINGDNEGMSYGNDEEVLEQERCVEAVNEDLESSSGGAGQSQCPSDGG